MNTYRELIYMCLDLLKGVSDDFFFTEEHVAYLLDKYRAFLLKQRYGNNPKKKVPYGNYQTINIKVPILESDNVQSFKSEEQIPKLLNIGIPRIVSEDYYDIHFEFVARERFPFVCNNRFLKRFWYGTIDEQDYFCLTSTNSRYIVDENNEPLNIKLVAVYENPKEVLDYQNIDYLDSEFPLEESLIPNLVELVIKALLGATYRPADTTNNSNDDMASMANFLANNMKSKFQKQLES